MATTTIYDEIWNALRNYEFFPQNIIPPDVRCSICSKIIVNPTSARCGCQYCFDCVKYYVEQGNITCPNTGFDCSKTLLDMTENILIDYATSRRVVELQVKCPFDDCKYLNELRDVVEHIRVCSKRPQKCPFSEVGCTELLERGYISEHLDSRLHKHGEMMMQFMMDFRNEVKHDLQVKREEIATLNANISVLMMDNYKLVQNNQLLRQELDDKDVTNVQLTINLNKLKTKMDKLIHHLTKQNEFVWKVNNFSDKRRQAMLKAQSRFESAPFYSWNRGYKLCLGLHPDGHADAKSNYLSLFFFVMCGDFDNSLKWPFDGLVSIYLINQNTGEPYLKRSFRYDTVENEIKLRFNRPSDTKNRGIGNRYFIDLEELYNNQNLIKNDTLLIGCDVNPSLDNYLS